MLVEVDKPTGDKLGIDFRAWADDDEALILPLAIILPLWVEL